MERFKDIALFWTAKEVDGFRYDMARNGSLWVLELCELSDKNTKLTDAFLLAEVYNTKEYRNYIQLGKMDYLYDKRWETYDKLKRKKWFKGKSATDGLSRY
jgi:hypothetical protein